MERGEKDTKVKECSEQYICMDYTQTSGIDALREGRGTYIYVSVSYFSIMQLYGMGL